MFGFTNLTMSAQHGVMNMSFFFCIHQSKNWKSNDHLKFELKSHRISPIITIVFRYSKGLNCNHCQVYTKRLFAARLSFHSTGRVLGFGEWCLHISEL